MNQSFQDTPWAPPAPPPNMQKKKKKTRITIKYESVYQCTYHSKVTDKTQRKRNKALMKARCRMNNGNKVKEREKNKVSGTRTKGRRKNKK